MENKKNLFNVICLALIISGAITFLFAIVYYEKIFISLSLIQLMCGSVGYYLINTPKTPL